ncbi:MAG: CRISPR-associated protein Cas5 [Promethearchaeia archaeon]
MTLIVCDIEGKFGSFSTPASNVGGLITYIIPPKTTVQGLLGSIVGLSFKETVEVFKDFKYTVKPFSPLKTVNTTFNCHYGRRGGMANINQELLIKPKYRLYLHIPDIEPTDEILSNIKQRFKDIRDEEQISNILIKIMEKRESYYTLYMGKNEFPLSYQLKDKEGWEKGKIKNLEDKEYYIDTALPRNAFKDLQIEMDSENEFDVFSMSSTEKFRIDNIRKLPKTQDKNREFQEFEDVILKQPKDNVSLKVKLKDKLSNNYVLYRKGNELIVCF